ncbi:MIR motif-containing protein [Mycena haematopus]|nr:MIR motif-containing protein [Mycena haematopus]
MPRSFLSSLFFVLVPGLLFLGFYNLRAADMSHDLAIVVDFGWTITMRHISTGGYLHSHELFYPVGSQQQQATIAPHRSEATMWRIYNATTRDDMPVMAGATVMLRHIPSSKYLHSHDVPAPVSQGEDQREVSLYGMLGFAGDANDDWIVEPIHGGVLAIASPFRLQHRLMMCYLSSRGAFLPEWGLGLQEVVCSHQMSEDNLWIIDAI